MYAILLVPFVISLVQSDDNIQIPNVADLPVFPGSVRNIGDLNERNIGSGGVGNIGRGNNGEGGIENGPIIDPQNNGQGGFNQNNGQALIANLPITGSQNNGQGNFNQNNGQAGVANLPITGSQSNGQESSDNNDQVGIGNLQLSALQNNELAGVGNLPIGGPQNNGLGGIGNLPVGGPPNNRLGGIGNLPIRGPPNNGPGGIGNLPIGGPPNNGLGGIGNLPIGGPPNNGLGGIGNLPIGGPPNNGLGGIGNLPIGGLPNNGLGGIGNLPIGGPPNNGLGGIGNLPIGGPPNNGLGGIGNLPIGGPRNNGQGGFNQNNGQGGFNQNNGQGGFSQNGTQGSLTNLVPGLVDDLETVLSLANIGQNIDDTGIERPCQVFDIYCIRRYFKKNGKCKEVRGPVPEPYFRAQSSLQIQRINATFSAFNVLYEGLNGRIHEFYINRKTDKLVMSIEFRNVTFFSRDVYYRFYRRGREPITTYDYLYINYKSYITTTIIPKVRDLQLYKSETTTFTNDAIPTFSIGPNAFSYPDSTVQLSRIELLKSIPIFVQEAQLTEGPFSAATFIQNSICDFKLKVL